MNPVPSQRRTFKREQRKKERKQNRNIIMRRFRPNSGERSEAAGMQAMHEDRRGDVGQKKVMAAVWRRSLEKHARMVKVKFMNSWSPMGGGENKGRRGEGIPAAVTMRLLVAAMLTINANLILRGWHQEWQSLASSPSSLSLLLNNTLTYLKYPLFLPLPSFFPHTPLLLLTLPPSHAGISRSEIPARHSLITRGDAITARLHRARSHRRILGWVSSPPSGCCRRRSLMPRGCLCHRGEGIWENERV